MSKIKHKPLYFQSGPPENGESLFLKCSPPDKFTGLWQLLKGNFGGFIPILRMGHSYKTYPLYNSKEGGAWNIKRDLLTGERMYFAPLYL